MDLPLDYTQPGAVAFSSLSGQNFLVTSAAHVCPAEAVAGGDFVNSNTLLHQNGTAIYNN